MSKFILENQHLPKLSKIIPPDNPYRPAVSGTSTEISRVFLLNDRGKVSLTESSSESEPQESRQASPPRFPTFQSPGLNFPDNDNSPPGSKSQLIHSKTSSYSSNHQMNVTVQSQNKESQLISKEQNFIYSKTPLLDENWQNTQNLYQPTKNTQNKKSSNYRTYEDSSKLNQYKNSNYSIKSHSLKTCQKKVSSYPQRVLEQPENIYNRYNKVQETHKYRQQDIADEEQTENIVQTSHMRGISLSLSSAHKPILQSASKVMEPISSEKGRSSLIEQLQTDNFIQSKVIENMQNKSNQTTIKKRKFKIFGNNSHQLSPFPSPNLSNIEVKPKVFKLFPQHQIVSEFDDRIQKKQNRGRNNSYPSCPHTECILKSLHIIDKLTGQKETITSPSPNGKHISFKEQREQKLGRVDEEIEMQCLDISLQMDKFLVDLSLESLNNVETIKMVKQIKISINKLITKIKDRNQYQNKKPYLNWGLCRELQRICNIFHCVQVVQERYKMWKLRLYHLKERIKDILNVNKQKQIQKLTDMKKHMLELHESKFYDSDINIAGHYNQFIDQELKELEGAVSSIENIILRT